MFSKSSAPSNLSQARSKNRQINNSIVKTDSNDPDNPKKDNENLVKEVSINSSV